MGLMSPTEKGKSAKRHFKNTPDATSGAIFSFPAAPEVPKSEVVAREEKILKFWKEKRIFEKSLESRKKGKTFVFYEGPPTANAAPGFHHVEARVFKDVIPRFKSMQGYYVPRRAGWDTHGLPVELQVEKSLGFKSKQDIEKFGIREFNEKCRESVWQYVQEFQKLTERIAFWLDEKDPYITYERSYMETLWWIIAEFWKKNLLYQDFKVLPWCTRCGTGLSSHEVALGYKSVVDASVYIRFKLTSQDPRWKNVALLSWTTTPWTLPGNLALAVSPSMQYVRVPDPEKKGNWVVVGQENFPLLLKRGVLPKDSKASVPFLGRELIGLSYQPLFHVPELVSVNSYKIYEADFVKSDEGSGIVHTAVMYGDDDYKLGKRYGLPTIHTVTDAGKFIAALGDGLAGKYVKAKETELLILQHLQRAGALFREEAYEHEYPFCWRCETPILYYARSSWWVKVNAVRKELLKNNDSINWLPAHLKRGRFGEWLREEKDWAFSRERYWGTTLPIWKCNACGDILVVSSVSELSERAMSSGNRYILMRHGESENIMRQVVVSWPEATPFHLTEKGKHTVREAAHYLKNEKIDQIFASDLTRTKETAEIVAEVLGDKEIIFDPRLREISGGVMNGAPDANYRKLFKTPRDKLYKAPEGGESLLDVRARMSDFFRETEKKYRGKTILIVTHADPAWMMLSMMKGLTEEEMIAQWKHPHGEYLAPAEYEIYEPKPLPLSAKGEVDLHRPYVDELKIRCSCGGIKIRVPEVADVWFDSGAMPFAQNHYPFENKDLIDKNKFFPADYICEAVDQTRGWFYTLLAESTLLGKGAPYKNVISLGHVLDKNGQKMSKSKGNAVNPWEMIEKYGADAIRWYFYTVNAPGDPKKFDEKDILGKLRGFLGTFWNSFMLFDTYTEGRVRPRQISTSLLDRWILSRLTKLVSAVTEHLDEYDIVSAARLIESFTVDDFSNWYLRRSRRRFQRPKNKREKEEVAGVTAEVLKTLVLISAPFVPYAAEAVYQGLKEKIQLSGESVHLAPWPRANRALQKSELEKRMSTVRNIAADALKARASANVKVRQPLGELRIKTPELNRYPELLDLIQEEVNVKKIVIDKKLLKTGMALNTTVTEVLRREGIAREIIRNIQELRRDLGLKPNEKIIVQFAGSEKGISVINEWQKHIKTETNTAKIVVGGKHKFRVERELPLGGENFWLGIR